MVQIRVRPPPLDATMLYILIRTFNYAIANANATAFIDACLLATLTPMYPVHRTNLRHMMLLLILIILTNPVPSY